MESTQAINTLGQLLNKANRAGVFELSESVLAVQMLDQLTIMLQSNPVVIPTEEVKAPDTPTD